METQLSNEGTTSDTISRQAAIKWCRPEEWGTPDERWRPESEFGAMLEALPSAEPERKKGFWYALQKGDKGYSAGDFKCSVCGEPNHTWLPKPNYCPNCGAMME